MRQQGSRNDIYLKSPAEIARMRRAGHLLQRIQGEIAALAGVGVSTLELDRLALARIREARAKPGFLGLYGFPNTLCISVNEEVVHGIPSAKRILQDGDIVSVDCGLILDGFYADCARTLAIGNVSEQARRLIDVTTASLYAGLAAARVDGRVGDIGAAVEAVVHAAGFSSVDQYTGHGIGKSLHEEPKVFNTSQERGRRIGNGLTVAVEPMVNVGGAETEELADGWTVVTKDRSLSAHVEHTVAVTRHGVEVLTMDPDNAELRVLVEGAGLLWREP